MSDRTTFATAFAFLLMVIMSCDSGSQSRKNSNSNRTKPGAAEGGEEAAGETESKDSEGKGESSGEEGEGGEESEDLAFAADETLFYSTYVSKVLPLHCLNCHLTTLPSLSSYEAVRNTAEDMKAMLMDPSIHPETTINVEDRVKLVNWILAGTKKAPSALSFLHPLRLNTPVATSTFEVKVALANNKPNATWKLFYSTTADATTGGTLIGGDQPLSGGGIVSWNVTNLPPGTYYLYAELKDGVESAIAKAPGSLRIGLPSVILGTGWREGSKGFLSNADLTYNVANKDNIKNYTVNLAVKKGDGAYEDIVTNNSDLTKYTLPGSYAFTDGVTYTFKATLLENSTEVHFDESLGPVGIATAVVSFATLRTAIFDQECIICHTLPSPMGSFRSDLYGTAEGAFARAETIVIRMNDAEMPMPLAGRLSIEDRDRVKLWYWLGAAP